MIKTIESKETFQNHLKNFLQTSSLLPQIYPNVSSNKKLINQKCPIAVKEHQRFNYKIFVNHTPARSKRKVKKSSINPLATIFHPNILHTYLSYNEIVLYLDHIKTRFMDFVKVHTLGTTFERRAIKCIEINWNRGNRMRSAPLQYTELKQLDNDYCSKNSGRNIIFIEGGTHAREWLSVAVALNCIYQLTEKNVRHRDLLCKLKFFIVPLVNPDGYEYARNVNPRWRKNRRPHIDGDHIGTDCNRNFDFHWEEGCSNAKRNTYQGDKPFSEHESKALATILNSLAPNLLFFLSLHSYAQSIMYPWGYSKVQPKNVKLMESVAIAGRNAIKTFSGRFYRVGSISHITKRKIGGSVVDYAYGAVKIPLTLVMELPANEYGFQPPVDKIQPLGMESWQGIREMCKVAFSLKAKIEEEEKTLDNKRDDINHQSLAKKEITQILNCDKNVISKETDIGKMLSNTIRSVQNQMSDGIINSMFDVVTV